jgi:hypothetical protein
MMDLLGYKMFFTLKYLPNMHKPAKKRAKDGLYFPLLVLPIHSRNSAGLSSASLDVVLRHLEKDEKRKGSRAV